MARPTKDNLTPDDLPKGRRPEEFLTDVELVGYYQRQLDAMKPNDSKRADVKRLLRSAKIGAASLE